MSLARLRHGGGEGLQPGEDDGTLLRRQGVLDGSMKLQRGLSQAALQGPALVREVNADGPPIAGVWLPANQPAPLQTPEHGRDGVGVGETATDQFFLRDTVFFGEKRQEDELIGGGSLGPKQPLELPMHGQIGGSQPHRGTVAEGHSLLLRIETNLRLASHFRSCDASWPGIRFRA